MKKISLFLSLFACLTLSSCSMYSVDSENTTYDVFPEKKNANDVVYLESVDRPHIVLGYVTVNTERRQHMSDVIEKMKREAAILGGDAITNIKSDATGTWKKLPAQKLLGKAYVRANFTAEVIVFQ